MQLRSLEDRGELCGNAVAAPSGEGQKHLFTPFEVLILPRRMWFSRRKSAFGSRTETEKLSLTYFLSSECRVLSSQAVWKSLGWETDSCNQTLALRRTSWILIGVPRLDEVKRSENQASANKRSSREVSRQGWEWYSNYSSHNAFDDLRGKDCQTVVESVWICHDCKSCCTEGNKVGISKQAPRITATTVLIKVLPSQTSDRNWLYMLTEPKSLTCCRKYLLYILLPQSSLPSLKTRTGLFLHAIVLSNSS